jgi:hypothetical protein
VSHFYRACRAARHVAAACRQILGAPKGPGDEALLHGER